VHAPFSSCSFPHAAVSAVVGRFTDRQAVYPLEPAPQNPIPVTSRTVVFVLTNQGVEG
jgi:hypothetical protein